MSTQNNRMDEDEPVGAEGYARLFDAIMKAEASPNTHEFKATLWDREGNQAVSGFKHGFPWTGLQPAEFATVDAMRKAAKDFRFYFDRAPKISLYISTTKKTKGKGTFKEILYLGSVPWHVLDEL